MVMCGDNQLGYHIEDVVQCDNKVGYRHMMRRAGHLMVAVADILCHAELGRLYLETRGREW